MNFFSIIIPLYNKEKFIKKVLKSIIDQSFKDFEIIIIDDYSNDNSSNIVKQIISSNSDLNIHYLVNSENKGVGFTRNVGLEFSQGQYVLFLDADDELASEKTLEIIHNYLLNRKIENLLLVRNYRNEFLKPEFKKIYRTLSVIESDLFKVNNKDKFSLKGNLPFGGSGSAVILRDIALKNRFNVSENIFEDWDYFLRVFNQSNVYFLNINCINVNLDSSTDRSFYGSIPKIYEYLYANKYLRSTRKQIFWIWFNKFIRNNQKLPNLWQKLLIANLSINFKLVKYQLRAVLNYFEHVVFKKT